MYNADYPDRADLPTTFRLVRSSFIAGISAIAILLTIVLPSEYGIDPFRIGGLLGLTQMGEIKVQLAQEAAAQATAAPGSAVTVTGATTPDPTVVTRLAAIETALTTIQAQLAPTLPALQAVPPAQEVADVAPLEPLVAEPAPQRLVPEWRDEVNFTLTPGQGTEYKLVMGAGAAAEYEWLVEGGVINVDIHGEGNGQSVKYEQPRGVSVGSGMLQPQFDGTHGWFFRNRGSAEVTVTLRVKGDYAEMRKLV